MAAIVKTALLYLLGGWVGLMAVVGCQSEPQPANSTLEIPSGREPNASVSGTVTYRERIALTPGAMLVVELRDTSYQDAAAELIARQTISDPGQVPIRFKVEYNREDIESRNTYSVSARIIESDGRLAFTNDTAYDVITRGSPSKVDMLLVLVQPPPNLVDEGDGLAHLGRDAGHGPLGEPDPERAGALPADRLLPVDHRGLRPARQREPRG